MSKISFVSVDQRSGAEKQTWEAEKVVKALDGQTNPDI